MRRSIIYLAFFLLSFNSSYANAEKSVISPIIAFILHDQAVISDCSNTVKNRIASGSFAYSGTNVDQLFLNGPISYTYDEDSSNSKLLSIDFQGLTSHINAALNIDYKSVGTYKIVFKYDTLGRPNQLIATEQVGDVTLTSEFDITYGANGVISRVSGVSQDIDADLGATIYDLTTDTIIVSNAAGEYESVTNNIEFLTSNEGSAVISPFIFKSMDFEYQNSKLTSYRYGAIRSTGAFDALGSVDFSYSGCLQNKIAENFINSQLVLNKSKPNALTQKATTTFETVSQQTANLVVTGNYENFACNESTLLLEKLMELVYTISSAPVLPYALTQPLELNYLNLCQ